MQLPSQLDQHYSTGGSYLIVCIDDCNYPLQIEC